MEQALEALWEKVEKQWEEVEKQNDERWSRLEGWMYDLLEKMTEIVDVYAPYEEDGKKGAEVGGKGKEKEKEKELEEEDGDRDEMNDVEETLKEMEETEAVRGSEDIGKLVDEVEDTVME